MALAPGTELTECTEALDHVIKLIGDFLMEAGVIPPETTELSGGAVVGMFHAVKESVRKGELALVPVVQAEVEEEIDWQDPTAGDLETPDV